MNAMSKKLLSLLLAVIMLIGVLPATAMAEGLEGSDTLGDTAAVTYTVTLDANGGSMNGFETATRTVEENKQIGTLPVPTKEGYNFLGWYNGETLVEAGTVVTGDMTVTAKWAEKTKNVLVKAVVSENVNGAYTLFSFNVAEQTNLLNYLKNNVNSQIPEKAGYSIVGDGEGNAYWWYYNGERLLIAQDNELQEAETVYVKYKANEYTLYFNANGGKCDTTSKAVTFDAKVGTLPTPTMEGKVFLGWYDENGTKYTADTVYTVAGDTTVTAKWAEEAFVLLKIYTGGKTDSADRIVDLTGYIVDSKVTLDTVTSIVKGYYSAQSGYTLKVDGLYTDVTWADYKTNNKKEGTPTVQIEDEELTYIYVMVSAVKADGNTGNSGNTGSTGNSGSTGNTGNNNNADADPSNPKTADESMIVLSMTMMALAAVAFVAMTGKKRMVK